MHKSPFHNLIRFQDDNLNVLYGNVPEESLEKIEGSTVDVLGDDLDRLQETGKTAVVRKLLSPVPHVPHFICIGLNYAAHAKEGGMEIPTAPSIFMKPADALAGPYDDVPVHPEAQLMDYEGELCIVIKKDGKNIKPQDALDHVLGYTVGNDVSSRYWQRPPRSGGQFCYAKSFDKFAPIGPTILAVEAADAESLHLTTKVNGEIRQSSSISDMVFNIRDIIAHASRGTTLRKGTVIMTGTPSGIAAKMAGTPWLVDGDVVEVSVPRIGTIRNRIVFE